MLKNQKKRDKGVNFQDLHARWCKTECFCSSLIQALNLTLGAANTEEDLAEARRVRAQGGRQPQGSTHTPSASPLDLLDLPAKPTTPTLHSQNQFLSSAGSWQPSPPSLSNTAQTPPRRKAPARLQAEVSFLYPAGGHPPCRRPVHPCLLLKPLNQQINRFFP